MFTIFAFLLSIIGLINWLTIGLFQYDFIAGIFGFQASILSRLFYILFGLSSLILIFKLIKGKGTIAVFSKKNKKDVKENINKLTTRRAEIEADKDLLDRQKEDNFNDKNYEFEKKDLSTNDDFDRHYRR